MVSNKKLAVGSHVVSKETAEIGVVKVVVPADIECAIMYVVDFSKGSELTARKLVFENEIKQVDMNYVRMIKRGYRLANAPNPLGNHAIYPHAPVSVPCVKCGVKTICPDRMALPDEVWCHACEEAEEKKEA